MTRSGSPKALEELLEFRGTPKEEDKRRQHLDYLEPNLDDDPIERGVDDCLAGDPQDEGPVALDMQFQ